jgi:hypothetical protein
MPLTRAFKGTVQARIKRDRKYREELLREGVECLLAGDLDTGKAILRDYINATIGFEKLSRLTGRPAKSLMRMLGPRGNPQARNLFEVIGQLQKIEGLHFEVSLRAASQPGELGDPRRRPARNRSRPIMLRPSQPRDAWGRGARRS